jgi:type I restriction enzyme, S subunit
MSDLTVTFAELERENLLELGAGRPRTVHSDQYPPLPILRVGDVLDGKIESSAAVSAANVSERPTGPKVSRPGDVVLTTKGTVGRVALMPQEGPDFAYSPQICYFRPAADGPLSPRYLYYWFKSAQFWKQADARKGQTDMADFLSLADIQSLSIRVPSLEQQSGVVDVLGCLDDKITVNGKIASTLHQLAQAVFAEAATGSDAVPLSAIAEVTMGSSPPGDTYNAAGIGLPFYQGTKDFGDRFPSKRVWCAAPVREAGSDDVLFSVRAPVGRVNRAVEACCIGRGLAAISSTTASPSTLFHALAAERDAWAPYESEGTVFGAINQRELRFVRIRFPRGVAQVEPVLAAIDARYKAAVMESLTLATLRDTLLPKLMSGELRVRDAEQIAGDAV